MVNGELTSRVAPAVGDVGRGPPRLVLGQQIGGRSSARQPSACPLLSLTMKHAGRTPNVHGFRADPRTMRASTPIRCWRPESGSSPRGATLMRAGIFLIAVVRYLAAHSPTERAALQRFDAAFAAEQLGNFTEAERLYRLLMKSDPTDASAPFNLGNMLRATSRTVEAEAALRAATRANPAFAEAWYNLADLLGDEGRLEAAVECLRKALVVEPDYIDATFNLALLLQRKGLYGEFAEYWRRYLARDRSSDWAVRARRSLKFCEIQVDSIGSAARSQADSEQAA